MNRGIYISASGMLQDAQRLDVIANNLANATTTGYKRDTVVSQTFAEVMIERLGDQSSDLALAAGGRAGIGSLGMGSYVAMTATRLRDGAVQYTGGDLDVALQGNALFAVQTPAGIRYTRSGSFTQDAGGRLVTSGGHPVLVDGDEAAYPGRRLAVTEQGELMADGAVVGRLTIVFTDQTGPLRKVGSNLYAADGLGSHVMPEPATEGQPYRLLVGYLEAANVEPVLEMVALMATMRSYEANQKALQIQDEALGKAANEVGRL